jgi:hypothetical protein
LASSSSYSYAQVGEQAVRYVRGVDVRIAGAACFLSCAVTHEFQRERRNSQILVDKELTVMGQLACVSYEVFTM